MVVKHWFNPLIEKAAIVVFGVDQYADIFEKMACTGWHPDIVRRALRRRLAEDVARSQLLFIHVPKNGGTSVKRALYRSDPGHASIRYYALFFPEFLTATETIAIVRDPVDRFLSGFDFLLHGGGDDVSIRAEPLRRLRKIGSVDALLDYLELLQQDWLRADTFLRPQSWYVADADGIIRIDHFWSMQRTGDGLSGFLQERGFPAIRHLNQTNRAPRTLEKRQRERLERLYANDFALYAEVSAAGGYSRTLTGMPVDAVTRAATSRSIAA